MSSTHTSPNPSQPQPPARKPASTGGGRAWSEEEENYLIETRQHKMPYKHIAAHLNKTELACRLHYHQLSFGTKRRQNRRRTSSVSSARSAASTNSSETAAGLAAQRPLPQLSPPDSPEQRARNARSLSPNGAPIPILPKPHLSGAPHAAAPGDFAPSNALRLITADVERYEERNRIDKQRLARIYDAHRQHFWGAIARDYGGDVNPAVLEDVWWRGAAGGHFPPTPPNRSPRLEKAAAPLAHPYQSHPHQLHPLAPAPSLAEIPPSANNGFHAVNAQPTPAASRSTSQTPSVPGGRGTFAISSLLTEDKEICTTQGPQLPPVIAH